MSRLLRDITMTGGAILTGMALPTQPEVRWWELVLLGLGVVMLAASWRMRRR